MKDFIDRCLIESFFSSCYSYALGINTFSVSIAIIIYVWRVAKAIISHYVPFFIAVICIFGRSGLSLAFQMIANSHSVAFVLTITKSIRSFIVGIKY